MSSWGALFLYCCVVLSVSGSKILFVSFTPSPSHQKPFQEIWRTLTAKGHEMHVLTPNPLVNHTYANLIQYDISDVYAWAAKMNQLKKKDIKYSLQKPNFLHTFLKEFAVNRGWHAVHEYTFQLPEVKRLLDTQSSFDAVIVEWLYPTAAALAGYYRAPLIGICSLGAPTNGLDEIGNILNPVVTPDQNVPIGRSDFSFRDRLLSALYSVFIRLYYHWRIVPTEDRTIRKYLGDDIPYLGDITRNISLLLLNRNQISHRLMSVVPGIVEFGGLKYDKIVQELEPGLKHFLDNSKNGVVYFSMGAAIKQLAFLSPQQIDVFRTVLGELPYNVVWKWDNETMDEKPDNVFISSWINQTAVLEHPNVKLFITQGGLQSTEEAIAAHKPIIGIPFHSDQTSNVDTCVKYGMGKTLDLEDITVERLRSYINEIMDNPSFAENAKYLDDLMKDQPQDGLDKAIWWIEYVIRHKGAKHLRSIAVDMPWWQYMMLDILAFLSAVLLSVLLTLYFSIRLLYILVNSIFKSKTKKGGKKKVQ